MEIETDLLYQEAMARLPGKVTADAVVRYVEAWCHRQGIDIPFSVTLELARLIYRAKKERS